MSWRYQIVKQNQNDHEFFGLHEVYDIPNHGLSWTHDAAQFQGNTADEVIEALAMALLDAKQYGVLDATEVIDDD